MKVGNLSKFKCVVFDFGFTLSSDLYFKVSPPECPEWHDIIQEHVFANRPVCRMWMTNVLSLRDIASIVSNHANMDISAVLKTMELGCKDLDFNEAVLNFALAQRSLGRRTAIVTANMDVFSDVVVPAHGLDEKFDVIINSSDYGEFDKRVLWPIAFKALGDDIHYGNSLLIEDGSKEPELFRGCGGFAYEYTNDESFLRWLDEDVL
ncbi:MAG: hypothetical protein OXI24_12725 [Candidatus Poribacteria bacterium]|nr:hypothetical protein [Candidatus Poribacteria bacterium]